VADQFFTPVYGIGYNESAWMAQSFEDATQVCSRRLQVIGRLVTDWLKEMLGWTVFVPIAGGALLRYPPATHPRFPWLNARSAQFVRELGPNEAKGPGGTLQYALEEWEIVYRADEDRLVRWWSDDRRPVGVAGEAWRYTARKFEQGVMVQPLPLGYLYFNKPNENGVNPVVPDGMTGQLVQSRTLWMTWYQIPVTLGPAGPLLPGRLQQTIDETVGTMNGTLFEGQAPQTLLMLDPKYVLKFQSDGSPVVDLTYCFSKRGGPDISAPFLNDQETDTSDYTRILRANGKYGRVYRKDDEVLKVKSVYAPKDFNRLFEFS
jgi:hypothetical protein